jgi:CheY-like chemotaxis protein
MGPKTILCIHDRTRFVSVFRSYFEERGYQVLAAPTGMEGVRLLKTSNVDAVVLDYEASEMSGAAAWQVIKGAPPRTLVLILSGAKSKISPDVRHAATAVLVKVFSPPELMRNVERILSKGLPAEEQSRVASDKW